ncbi:MAG: methyltransferase domain-containing protein, partial [bacterium]|nr:methyltransferase domain-containing protein [bacterium]
KAKPQTQRCSFFAQDIMAVNQEGIPDNSFDVVVNDNVLEHICPDEAVEFIRQCKAKLKCGGWLITVTPNRLVGPYDVSRHFLPKGAQAQGLHLKEYTFQELFELITGSGFSKILTLPAAAHLSVRLGMKKGYRIWCYKSLIIEKVFRTLPAFFRGQKVFKLFVSDIILAQK